MDLKQDFIKVNYILSIILTKLGKLDEAEIYSRKVTTLKPDFAEAHNNLGNILKELSRLSEAEASLRQAITLKSDFAEAHYNLGNILEEQGKLNDAEASLRQAITLKPDFAEAHSNLGNILKEIGRLDEAVVSLNQALLLKPDLIDAIFNLSIVHEYMNNLNESAALLKKLMEIDKNNQGLKAAVQLAIFKFLEKDFSESKKILLACHKIQEMKSFDFNNHKLYQSYLLKILNNNEKKIPTTNHDESKIKLYVIGDSHSLVSHGQHIKLSAKDFLCKSLLVPGCKQFDLGNDVSNKFKYKFKKIFCSIPESSQILLTIGEIDCRLDGGIIKHKNRYPKKNITALIKDTVENYLNYISTLNLSFKHNIIIQGVPCPNINITNISMEKIEELIKVIRYFNVVLKEKSKKIGFEFLDVYKLTDNGNGFSNNFWHLDEHHLSLKGIQEAWRIHTTTN